MVITNRERNELRTGRVMVTSRPTGNFRDISVHPREEDLDHRRKVYLRPNIGTGGEETS